MEVDFDSLQKKLKELAPQRKQRVYDWESVLEWIKGRDFVTQRAVEKQANTKYHGIAQQWLQRHTYLIVNVATREKAATEHPEGELVKVVQGKNCVYVHRENIQKLLGK